jgi:DNA polymerase-3 subunit epsilon
MIFDNSVILDIEATGGVPKQSRIIEIGLIVFQNGKKVMEWERLINPNRRISRFIQNYIGISNEMVQEAPKFEDISEELTEILDGKLLIAHNAFTDLEFLQKEFRRLKVDYKPQILCSLKLSQKIYPIFRKHGLDSVIERHGISSVLKSLGIDSIKRHRALGDVFIVWFLLQQMERDFDTTYLQSNINNILKQINLKAKLLRYV